MSIHHTLEDIIRSRQEASLVIETLGGFRAFVNGREITPKDWGRDKTAQLIQFFITARHRHGLHKEQIIDRLWADSTVDEGMRDIKVALHGINKALEPNRKPRVEAKYILRQGVTYQLSEKNVWIDVEAFDKTLALGGLDIYKNPEKSKLILTYATDLYKGTYLPNRIFDDWTATERERLQLLAINAMINLGELTLESNPSESIRLAQEALIIDSTWEEAYRLQMMAYSIKKNRPQVIKTYQTCAKVLDIEFGIDPLPETKRIYDQVMGI
ncbi:MAG: DNA-binding SARP family transcriptional activator [Saprospiraceae bacterium]|jgi:DNA-binding SARP family transcriptional activator